MLREVLSYLHLICRLWTKISRLTGFISFLSLNQSLNVLSNQATPTRDMCIYILNMNCQNSEGKPLDYCYFVSLVSYNYSLCNFQMVQSVWEAFGFFEPKNEQMGPLLCPLRISSEALKLWRESLTLPHCLLLSRENQTRPSIRKLEISALLKLEPHLKPPCK